MWNVPSRSSIPPLSCASRLPLSHCNNREGLSSENRKPKAITFSIQSSSLPCQSVSVYLVRLVSTSSAITTTLGVGRRMSRRRAVLTRQDGSSIISHSLHDVSRRKPLEERLAVRGQWLCGCSHCQSPCGKTSPMFSYNHRLELPWLSQSCAEGNSLCSG